MIVVEGPDGSGKSTLVRRLAEMYGLKIGARGVIDRDLLWTVTVNDTLLALGRCVEGRHSPDIWDRLYYSDFVYAPLGATPRPVAFNESQQVHIDKVIEAVRFPIIVCLPPKSTVLENIAGERHQMPGVKDRSREIYNEYYKMAFAADAAIKPFPEHRVVYDYTDDGESFQYVLSEIEDYLEERQERMI